MTGKTADVTGFQYVNLSQIVIAKKNTAVKAVSNYYMLLFLTFEEVFFIGSKEIHVSMN